MSDTDASLSLIIHLNLIFDTWKNVLKKHRLDDLFELNSQVYALYSAIPFIQLAFHLKRELNFSFERDKDIHWDAKEMDFFAPVYRYHDKMFDTHYMLIRNSASAGFVVPEHKKVDAFLVETNFNQTFSLTSEKLSKSRFVQLCLKIEVATLKAQSQQLLDIN